MGASVEKGPDCDRSRLEVARDGRDPGEARAIAEQEASSCTTPHFSSPIVFVPTHFRFGETVAVPPRAPNRQFVTRRRGVAVMGPNHFGEKPEVSSDDRATWNPRRHLRRKCENMWGRILCRCVGVSVLLNSAALFLNIFKLSFREEEMLKRARRNFGGPTHRHTDTKSHRPTLRCPTPQDHLLIPPCKYSCEVLDGPAHGNGPYEGHSPSPSRWTEL